MILFVCYIPVSTVPDIEVDGVIRIYENILFRQVQDAIGHIVFIASCPAVVFNRLVVVMSSPPRHIIS